MIALQSTVCSRKWVIATVCIHVHETDIAGHKVNCTYNSDLSSFVSWWEQVNFQWNDDDVHFVLDQHA